MYRIAAIVLCALLIGWVYTHTDELTVVMAVLIAFGFTLGFLFPRMWLATFVLLGAVCPISEILIVTVHIHTPFEGGHPMNACAAFVPALLSTALGRWSRKAARAHLQ